MTFRDRAKTSAPPAERERAYHEILGSSTVPAPPSRVRKTAPLLLLLVAALAWVFLFWRAYFEVDYRVYTPSATVLFSILGSTVSALIWLHNRVSAGRAKRRRERLDRLRTSILRLTAFEGYLNESRARSALFCLGLLNSSDEEIFLAAVDELMASSHLIPQGDKLVLNRSHLMLLPRRPGDPE